MSDEVNITKDSVTPLVQAEEEAALYVAGALPPEARAEFERRLEQDAGLREQLQALDAAAAALVTDIEPVEPEPGIRTALLARIAEEDQSPLLSEDSLESVAPILMRASDDAGVWHSWGLPGVSIRVLHADRERLRMTALLKLAPGAEYPSHVHEQAEECLVLQGDLDFGEYVLHEGDYLRLEAGTSHSTAKSARGCLCLIIAALPDFLAA